MSNLTGKRPDKIIIDDPLAKETHYYPSIIHFVMARAWGYQWAPPLPKDRAPK